MDSGGRDKSIGMSKTWDVAVLGGGIAGTMTTYHCAVRGLSTICVDASDDVTPSRGYARVLRTIGDGSASAAVTLKALEQIREMERTLGRTLFIPTGVSYIGNATHIGALHRDSSVNSESSSNLTHAEVDALYPDLCVAPDCVGVKDKRGGILLADNIIAAAEELSERCGARISKRTRCVSIDTNSAGGVTVRTDNGSIYAKQVVIALGAWVSEFLRPTQIPFAHDVDTFQSIVGFYDLISSRASTPRSPFVYLRGAEKVWGVEESENWKIGISGPHPSRTKAVSPREISGELDEDAIELFDKTVREVVGINRPALAHRQCFDGYTPDKEFVVGRHPQSSRIHFLVGLSGRGFKMAPALASTLVTSLMTEPPDTAG